MARVTTLLLALLFIVGDACALADTAWKAGFAHKKITPQERVFLAGYASRDKPFESVADDLYVKALALEDSEGSRAVIVTSDLIGFRADYAEPICQRIMEQTGLARGCILLNSSHTHTGPRLSLDAARLADRMTEAQAEATAAYTRQVMDDTVAVAVEALKQMTPARLSYGVGVAKFVMNRREHTPRGVRLGVNPRGLADRSVPVLRIDDADGNLRSVLYQVACHNTTLGGQHYFISGDFAGLSQTHIQEQHPGAQAMFMIGCGGSANPYPRGSLKAAKAHGQELGEEVCRVLQSKLTPVSGPLRVAFDYAELPLQRPPTKAELAKLEKGGGWQPWVAGKIKETLESEGQLPTHYRCPLAVWQFGDDLTLVGLSGEVVVDYVPLLERALGPLNLWISAYCNDVFGYLPSARVLAEGGYETRGLIYGGIGFFSPDAQTALVEKVSQLAKQVGR